MRQLLLELAPAPLPTLENFFPGPNESALAALRDALLGAERVVYLFGEAGCGKTHLLRATVREADACGAAALYVSAPHAALSASGPRDRGIEPRAQARRPLGSELLAVDDIEQLDAPAQLALFDAFNALSTGTGRVLGAGFAAPADLPLREDLRTRLGSGVSLHLSPLDDEQKRAALTWHAARRGLRLAPEIVDYVLTRCGRDMGTQIAVLDALDRYSLERKRPATLQLLREVLRDAKP